MTGVLEEIGGKLAERWVSLLALPGLLFLGVVWAGHTLGPGSFFSTELLTDDVERAAAWVDRHGSAGLFLALVGVLGAAVVPGLAVRVGAEVLATVWLGDWPAGPLVRRRQKRRALADAEVQAQVVALGVAEDRQRQDEIKAARDAMREAEVRRDNIALVVPARATRMGDRVHAMEERVQRYYRVPLGLLWPRVWLTASEPQRVEVRETAGAFDASTRLGAWGLLYVVGGAATLWWPASAAGAVAVAASWWTGRQRLFALADLVESLVDLRIGPVARMVGVASKDGPLPEVVGDELNLLMKRLRLPREPEAP